MGLYLNGLNSDRDLDHPVFVGVTGSCGLSAEIWVQESIDFDDLDRKIDVQMLSRVDFMDSNYEITHLARF